MLFIPWRSEDTDFLAGHPPYKARYNAKKTTTLDLLERYSPGRSAVEEAIVSLQTLEHENDAPNAQHEYECDMEEKNFTTDDTFVQTYDI